MYSLALAAPINLVKDGSFELSAPNKPSAINGLLTTDSPWTVATSKAGYGLWVRPYPQSAPLDTLSKGSPDPAANAYLWYIDDYAVQTLSQEVGGLLGGVKYDFSFDVIQTASGMSNPGDPRVQVSIGGTQITDFKASSIASAWTQKSFTYTPAASGAASLVFKFTAAPGAPNSKDLGIDRVYLGDPLGTAAIVTAVPEMNTSVLLGLGLALVGLGKARFRR